MPRTMFDLAESFAAMPGAIREGEYRGVKAGATAVAEGIRVEIRKVTGDMRLSGVGKGGAKVGAGFKPISRTGEPTAYIRKRGPLHLIENNTGDHVIYPKGQTFSTTRKGNLRRRGKTKALKFGGRFAAYSDHPGTRGQHPFQRGWRKTKGKVPNIVEAEIRKAMVRGWS